MTMSDKEAAELVKKMQENPVDAQVRAAVSACIAQEMARGRDQEQAIAICYEMARRRAEGIPADPELANKYTSIKYKGGERVKEESTPEEIEPTVTRQSPNRAQPMRWQDRHEIWLKRWFWLVGTIVAASYVIWLYTEFNFPTLLLWLLIPIIVAVGLLFRWFTH